MIKYLEDCLLSFLQKRCDHPGQMVAVDILEGGGDKANVSVAYCRRCGAVKIGKGHAAIEPFAGGEWRLPMPHLWRGYSHVLEE